MLCKEARNYISTAKGLPFFYVVGDEEYNAALDDLSQAGLAIVRISDFCPKDDKFPNIDELVDFFRTSDVDFRANKCVVIGLGEYLALRGAAYAEKVLARLKNTTIGNARAVLLLRGISAQATRIVNNDNKMIEQQRAYLSTELLTNIIITNIPNGSLIVKKKGIKALLHDIEDGAFGKVYVSTALDLSDSLFPATTLSNAYSIMRSFISGFSFEQSFGDGDQWEHLLSDLSQNGRSLARVFAKNDIDDLIFDDFYLSVSGLEYRNWLVFLYLKQNIDTIQNAYLKLVLEGTSQFDEFKINLLVKIIEYTHHDLSYRTLYEARKKLLKSFPEEDIAIFLRENEVDPEESIYRLTDNTSLEKKAIIKWVAHYGINDALAYVYPALDQYLKRYVFDSSVLETELTEYFDAYKKCKVTNSIPDEFMSMVEKYASGLSYARLPTRDNAIKSIADKGNTFLYWIDALGVEYMSYITALAKKRGLSIQTEITRVDLPTITSFNRQFYDQWTGGKKYKEGKLDEIKHKADGGYFFTEDEDPIHIPAELEVIEKAVSTAALELGLHNCKTFVITGDHGASRLAVIRKQEVPYDTDTKGEHSGRCCKEFDGCDLPYIVKDNGYIMLSDYGRFRGSRAANVEVHGGASLEEIVVPVIKLTLRKVAAISIKVIKPNDIIADRHEGVTLRLFISGSLDADSIRLVIDGNTYLGKAEDDTHFAFELKDIKRAKSKPYEGELYEGEDLIGSVSFKVKGKTATIKDDFDFGDEF